MSKSTMSEQEQAERRNLRLELFKILGTGAAHDRADTRADLSRQVLDYERLVMDGTPIETPPTGHDSPATPPRR